MLKGIAVVAGCATIAQMGASTAFGQTGPPAPRLVNGGAERGMEGWRGAGFGTLAYDGDIPQPPAGGAALFAAPSDASIWQDVDFSDLAATIDLGQQSFSVGGQLGGRGELAGAARLVAQPLDGAHAPLGAPLVAGNPSERDKQSQTTLLGCFASGTAPLGMRSVRLTVEAVGHGLADDLWVVPGAAQRPTIHVGRIGFLSVPSDGPGCYEHFEPIAPPGVTPPPAVQSLVVMPAAKRCGLPAKLRFRVDRRWRSSVTTFSVTARGKRLVRSAGEPIIIAAPERSLRVTVSARLKDGRRSSGTQVYSGC